jgi:hypothetical protein
MMPSSSFDANQVRFKYKHKPATSKPLSLSLAMMSSASSAATAWSLVRSKLRTCHHYSNLCGRDSMLLGDTALC